MNHFETTGGLRSTRCPTGVIAVVALAGLFVVGIGPAGLQGAAAATRSS